MNSIAKRQNTERSLKLLTAQRYLYQRAKIWHRWGFWLVVLVGFLAVASAIIGHALFSYAVMVFALVSWFLDFCLFAHREKKLKSEAALFQEQFDCEVLELPMAKAKGLKAPTSDRLDQLYLRGREAGITVDELRDWYTPESIPENPTGARLHCQRVNCWWDSNLRARYRTMLIFVIVILVVMMFSVAICTGVTVGKVVALVASGLRVVAWTWKEVQAHGDAQKRMEELHRMLSEEGVAPSIEGIREIQSEIFEHRRSCPPIPEWFFKMDRKSKNRERVTP